jgi:eukaryotic-like serine/threonine-protein kinase
VSREADAAAAHALFEELLDLEPVERQARLERYTADRPAVRARVEALLRHDAAAHPLLDGDASRLWALLLDGNEGALRDVGPYRLVRELGRGGMGVVYLAERADPELRQTVALKIVGPRPDAGQLAVRFRRERQILADLQHPNIAQLLDGGVTPEGLPWLAMEYVEGERIDAWCDGRCLSVEARLRLFLTVCHAVQHAQQKLVVHRDLKPANILVTDGGVVKLLDFGIAKLLPAGAVTADATLTATQALTPRYASPEQIRGGIVSTATDVWALGVVLHELLGGAGPFAAAGDAFEATRAVLEKDPAPPSLSVAPDHPAACGTTPRRLRQRLRGELDAIVLKALEREPSMRYPTAAALAEDIARHLRHEPVAARPAGALYRLRKLARRRRGTLAATAAIALLAAGAGAVHTVRITEERNRAQREAAKAEEARDFLLGLFNSGMPQQSLGTALTVGDLLERGVARADSMTDRPELRALLLSTLGDVFRVLAQYDRAAPLIEAAVDAYRDLATDELGLADALVGRAMLHYDLGEFEAALPPTHEALAIQRRLLHGDDPKLFSSLGNLATLASRTGDVEAALHAHEELLARRSRARGRDDPGVGVSLNNIGAIHYRAGRLDEAARFMRQALELRRRILPRQHPDLALSVNNLASVLRDAGDLDAAEALYREALALRTEVLGPDHPGLAVTHYNLGRLLRRRGELAAAEPHLRAALEIDTRVYGPDHAEVGVDAMQLAGLLAELGDCRAAEPLFAVAARIFALADRTTDLESLLEQRAPCSITPAR